MRRISVKEWSSQAFASQEREKTQSREEVKVKEEKKTESEYSNLSAAGKVCLYVYSNHNVHSVRKNFQMCNESMEFEIIEQFKVTKTCWTVDRPKFTFTALKNMINLNWR